MWRQRRLHISIHAHTRPVCRQPPNRWLAVVLWRRKRGRRHSGYSGWHSWREIGCRRASFTSAAVTGVEV